VNFFAQKLAFTVIKSRQASAAPASSGGADTARPS
jgi:hypothetical protein